MSATGVLTASFYARGDVVGLRQMDSGVARLMQVLAAQEARVVKQVVIRAPELGRAHR